MLRSVLGALAATAVMLGAAQTHAQTAWISRSTNDVTRINTATDVQIAGTTGGVSTPYGVLATATRVYVANFGGNTVTVLDAANSTFVATVTVGTQPFSLALSPDGTRVYVSNRASDTVSVIITSTNTVVGSITAGTTPEGVAVSPDGATLDVTPVSHPAKTRVLG